LLCGAAVCALAAVAVLHTHSAMAQAAPAQGASVSASRPYNIPAQPLTSALNQFGRQSGLQVAFPAEASRGIRSNAVVGNFTPQQALSRLLRGTGVSHRITSQGIAVIGAPPSASASDIGAPPADGSVLLDTIDVATRTDRNATSGSGFQGTPDWVYEAPAAVSVISRQAIEESATRNTRDLLDNVAGVYANRSEAQNPGITINIRGLQDQDRIATMIDGARQSFQRAGHGSSQLVYVDTAFIRTVDIEKSSTSGVGSAGSLGGSVNFRTLIADDLIKPGRQWGGQFNATTGTNAFNFDGSAVAAVRLSDSFSILGGIGHKDIGAFDIGKNGDLKLSTGTTANGVLLFSGQEVTSGILKAEAKLTDDSKFTLGWLRSDSKFSTGGNSDLRGLTESNEKVVNDTYTSAFEWKPDNDLVNLKTRFYYNHTKDDLVTEGNMAFAGKKIPINYTMGTLGGSIENTSRFDTALGRLSLNYGAEAFHDDGKGKVGTSLTDVAGNDASSSLVGGTGAGKRTIASGFANGTLDHNDWLTLSGGLRYDHYHISGSSTIYGSSHSTPTVIPGEWVPGECIDLGFPVGIICSPGHQNPDTIVWVTTPPEAYNTNVDKSGGALLPTFTVAVKPVDWLQPFIKYSKSFRPPTIMESFFTGGHDAINGYAPNPDLRPERGSTWELGTNITRDRIFTDRDALRLKIVGFYREITDYITIGRYYRSDSNRYYDSFINLDGVTRMKGVEIEGNYDARSFYIGGSVTYNETDWSERYTVNGPYGGIASLNGSGPPVLFVQPRFRIVVDGGVRLIDEKLTLGGRVTHVTPTQPTLGSLLPETTFGIAAYTVYDLYGSYAFTDDAKLRFAVKNLTDVAYAPAVGASYYAAPGRTYTASVNFKF
jgi:hemoglobin/transferrin/lactoferrin receptor protein